MLIVPSFCSGEGGEEICISSTLTLGCSMHNIVDK